MDVLTDYKLLFCGNSKPLEDGHEVGEGLQ